MESSSSSNPTAGLTNWLRKQRLLVVVGKGAALPMTYDSPADMAGFHWVRQDNPPNPPKIIKVFESQITIVVDK